MKVSEKLTAGVLVAVPAGEEVAIAAVGVASPVMGIGATSPVDVALGTLPAAWVARTSSDEVRTDGVQPVTSKITRIKKRFPTSVEIILV